MGVNHAVNLNLSAAGVPPVLHMAQYDANSRTIVATLWDGTSGFTIPTGASVMVRFGKPDGTGGLYDETEAGDAITYSGNVVTAPVAAQMLSVAGKVQADIEIYQTGETEQAAVKLATFCFMVNVEKAAYQDAEIISSDYYNIVAGQIQQAVSAATAAEQSKTAAAASAANAAQNTEDAEAWAVGQRNGVDVGEDDPAYHNNAKYYKEQTAPLIVTFLYDSESGGYTANKTGGNIYFAARNGIKVVGRYDKGNGEYHTLRLLSADQVGYHASATGTGTSVGQAITSGTYQIRFAHTNTSDVHTTEIYTLLTYKNFAENTIWEKETITYTPYTPDE